MEDCSVYDSSTDNGDRDGSIDVADVVVGGHDHSCVEVGVSDLSNEERRVYDLNSYTILRTEVGSTAHGVTHSSNDMDEIAVYIQPISEVVGLSNPSTMCIDQGVRHTNLLAQAILTGHTTRLPNSCDSW